MQSIKIAFMVYALGAVISMLVAVLINVIYRVLKGSEKSAKGA
ncbi:MAG: hypothetical protein ACYDEJ_09085 [Desulfitobacteriaceae bacterium]